LFVITNGCSCVKVLLNNNVNKKVIAHFIESVNKVTSPLNMQTEKWLVVFIVCFLFLIYILELLFVCVMTPFPKFPNHIFAFFLQEWR
jgi:hypothetical protein